MSESVVFVWQFDPRGGKLGGVGRYVLSFIRSLPISVPAKIIGVTLDPSEVGGWQKISVAGREIDFLPVVCVGNQNRKSKVPLLLKFYFGLRTYRKKLDQKDVIFSQRVEYLPALSSLKNRKYTIFHYDIEQYLGAGSGESSWAGFSFVFIPLLKYLLKRCDGVLSVNSNTIGFLNSHNMLAKGAVFAPTWPDYNVFDQGKASEDSVYVEHFSDLSKRLLVSVGRLNKQKNIELLLRSLVLIPDVNLLVVGEGDARSSAQALVNDLELGGRVFFTGAVEQVEIAEFLAAADLYVSPSLTEGMSVALLEALAMGVPVVTTPTGESKNIITNGKNGYVTESWDTVELCGAVVKGLKLKSGISRQSISRSIGQWRPEVIVPQVLSTMEID